MSGTGLDLLRILVRRDFEARVSVRQLLAFAESAVAAADLHLCIFDCFKGEAESKGQPANLTLVFGSLLVAASGSFIGGF